MPSMSTFNQSPGATNTGIWSTTSGSTVATNDSWPTYAGNAEPGSTVHFELDGTEYSVPTDENGAWDWSPPQALSDGEHELSTWVEKGGEKSDIHEVELDVTADSVARQNDYRRQQEWKNGNAQRHHDSFRPTTGGGGGAGDQTAVTTGPTGTATPVAGGGGFEKGSGTAVAVGGQPQGTANLEKGNEKEPCAICQEPRGDETPCPHCGME